MPATLPGPDVPGAAARQALERASRSMLAPRARACRVVNVALLFDAGYAADPAASRAPRASRWTCSTKAPRRYDALADRRARRVARRASSTPAPRSTTSTVGVSALTATLDPSLALFADVVLQPDASAAARSSACASSGSPASRARRPSPRPSRMRVLPPLLYGDGPSVRDPVHRHRHRGLDRRADARRPRRASSATGCARTTPR